MSSGIGLANVRERLRVIYGATYQLTLTSEPGKGTRARIEIPELRRDRRADTITAMSHRNSPLRVMVVDDEQLAREELCYQLEQLGEVEVVAQAGNGLEALAAVERHEPDLVFLDIQMPGLSGFEVARRLLEREDDVAGAGVRHGVRPARHRGVRGQRRRLPAQAGGRGAAGTGAGRGPAGG